MTDKTDKTDNTDNNDDGKKDDKPKASDKEVAELIKAQAAEIERLKTENAGIGELKTQVETLQSTLGTQSSITELIEQVKAMNAAGDQPVTEQEKAASELQKAADAGDMKTYRKLREAQRA